MAFNGGRPSLRQKGGRGKVDCLTGVICKMGNSFCTFSFGLGFCFSDTTFLVQKENLQQCFHVKTSGLDKTRFACLEVKVFLPVGMPVIQLQDNTWWRRAKEW